MNRFATLLKRAATIAIASLGLMAGHAHAGCGTIWTANLTDKWMWVTIYDLGKTQHLDWGWVGPHDVRGWHAGGAPTPQVYLCGSFYHVRAEAKDGHEGGNTIADTEIQINPQLKNWVQVVGSIVTTGLTCTDAPEVCAVKWGLNKGIDMAIFGNESNGGIVCLVSHDNKSFFWVEGADCANKDVKNPWYVKPTKPSPAKITLKVMSRVGPGQTIQNATVYFGPDHQMPAVVTKGKWSTPTPKVVKIHDGTGRYQVIGKGKGIIAWTYEGKTYTAEFVSQ
jgi:hypothetical protein